MEFSKIMDSKIIFKRIRESRVPHDFVINDSVKVFLYELRITDYEI